MEISHGDSSPSTKIVLYSYWKSSCSWRVRFALRLKGLAYKYKAVNLAKREHFSPEFEKLNPLHFVPVLVDGSVVVAESYAILLYLEDKYPQIALLPADPKLKAINLQIASIINSSIQPFHMLGILKRIEEMCGPEESRSFAQSNIDKGFHCLENLLQKKSGRYATGEQLHMADVFLAPQIAVAADRFGVDMSKFPTLGRIYEAYKLLPEFHDSSPQKQPDAEN
uniref:glutathione transferase n=1 Tax=Kalanchoe fedtschenkoi TaxID=63787 RepID=A0A7N0TDH0_KALFE